MIISGFNNVYTYITFFGSVRTLYASWGRDLFLSLDIKSHYTDDGIINSGFYFYHFGIIHLKITFNLVFYSHLESDISCCDAVL